MRKDRLFTAGFAVALACTAISVETQAQTRTRTQARAQTQAQPQGKCLRALDGSCTNPVVVEAARLRAIIIPSVRVSYYGTPAGTVGGNYIRFERLFQDDAVLFGLPTNVFSCCGVITRSK